MKFETEGKLQRNELGRWEVLDVQLCSGSPVDILIDGHWISGVIEHWQGDYYWFSRYDGIPVILSSSIVARIPQ